MRSRAARLTFCTVAWTALAAAGFFLVRTEKQISQRREAFRAFDQHAREATDALADMRAAQHAYVAAGQGVAFWMPKVAALLEDVAHDVDGLRGSAASAEAGGSLIEAAANVTEFGNVDRRARDYLQSGQTLMAGDVVFTEGGETAALAARQVESARLAERRALDASEAALRRQQAIALGAAAGLGVLVMGMLAFAKPVQPRRESAAGAATPGTEASPEAAGDLALRVTAQSPVTVQSPVVAQNPVVAQSPKAPARATVELPRGSVPVLKAAADLCTELSRVNDAGELQRVLARAADIMDARGLVVWIGNTAGADLRPVLAHGYPDQVLARLPTVPRSADNAAAAAYRTGELQIVRKQPGVSNGAVVVPLMSPEGCVGAFSAEILSGSETADSVQALAAIFAAQLAGVLVGSASTSAAADSAAGRVISR
jgi:hypothetical protein